MYECLRNGHFWHQFRLYFCDSPACCKGVWLCLGNIDIYRYPLKVDMNLSAPQSRVDICNFSMKISHHILSSITRFQMSRGIYTYEIPQWGSYQIRKIAGCACVGNAGNDFPRGRLQRKPLASDPDMHHGTCGIAYPRWRGKRSRLSRRMRTRNFTYLARGPCYEVTSPDVNIS